MSCSAPRAIVHGAACRVALVAMCVLVSGCASLGPASPLRPIERSLVYVPTPYPKGDWSPPDLDFEDVWLSAEDGTRLHGWFLDHERPRGVALFMHGNGGNLTTYTRVLRNLNRRHGLAVMAFDYRGYGRSKGKPSEKGVLQDARAARSWLAHRTGLAEQDIVLVGFSLGGAVAIDLAANDGARGLVVMSSFTTLPDVAAEFVPWVSPRANMTQRFNSLEKVKRYEGHILISHGESDRVIPYDHGLTLYEAAPGPKGFVAIPDGKHVDPDSEEYHRTLQRFIASLPPLRQNTQLGQTQPVISAASLLAM